MAALKPLPPHFARARLATLKAAREMIATPDRWTQSVSARDAAGGVTTPYSSDACSFCLYGAVQADLRRAMKQFGLSGTILVGLAMDALETVIGSKVWDFNDAEGRTHGEVVAKLDEAIALAEAACGST